MDRKSLFVVSGLLAFDAIPKAKKDEEFEAFVKRAYPELEKTASKSSNPVIQDFVTDCKDPLLNAIGKIEAKWQIVRNYCAVNDPFKLVAPKEATVEEILQHNGVKGSVSDLKKIMGDEAFDNYIERLRKPKKDGLTQTQIKEKEIEHFSKYEPVFPSEKEYTHGSGGTTRGWHWQSAIQDQYLAEHEAFLKEFGLEDSFPVYPEPETESDSDDGDKKEAPTKTSKK